MHARHARTRLSPHPTTPAAARRFVRDVLHRWSAGFLEEPVLLCTGELVTNAIVHVSSDIEVEVTLVGDVVRVAVHDASPTPPLRQAPGADAESGRGLLLVEALSARWGVERLGSADGKAVWFEVPLTSAA